jgi:hypothetical protein
MIMIIRRELLPERMSGRMIMTLEGGEPARHG